MKAIEVNNLTKSYGKARGVIDVSFGVEEGEIFGFIGPNGAGKSTTIRTLLGLIKPTAGSTAILGHDSQLDGVAARSEVGYLPSEVFYYDNLKVIDLLRYSAQFYGKNCDTRIKELAEIMDLDLTRKIDDLSYGNKKKVGIVQGLLHQPRVIILDEPTGGLDPLMQQTFFRLLESESQRGATILFSSHVLSEVQRMCHRVAIIKEGRLITTETLKNLKANAYKYFTIETQGAPALDAFVALGAKNGHVEGNTITFLYRGDLKPVLQQIAALDIVDFTAREPELEEIFLHYYQKEA